MAQGIHGNNLLLISPLGVRANVGRWLGIGEIRSRSGVSLSL